MIFPALEMLQLKNRNPKPNQSKETHPSQTKQNKTKLKTKKSNKNPNKKQTKNPNTQKFPNKQKTQNQNNQKKKKLKKRGCFSLFCTEKPITKKTILTLEFFKRTTDS